ncbi:hypothetical protein [Endozoicomonas sp. 4G]|uniref:hypothetical protein n=1 Tax=Endozoicomonas sp. 4G TaxID=2872754 RepID=UPI002078E622|nr:hypothetical protein [Endozoicomonas sp. 4G]
MGKIDENAAACHIISETINHLHWLKAILIEKDVRDRAGSANPNIQVFSNAIELLDFLNPYYISITQEREPDHGFSQGYSYTWLHFFYKGKPLFSVKKLTVKLVFQSFMGNGQILKPKSYLLNSITLLMPQGTNLQKVSLRNTGKNSTLREKYL